jgi:nitrate/TMAO reductase-like tetraheme cytochrome c subunit
MPKKIKTILASLTNLFMQLRWFVRILVILAIVVPPFSAAMIVITGKPTFCNSCHIMNRYYDSWETSAHNEVNCLACHLQPGFAGYVKGKINGLAQAVDCMVGRIGTKANATVTDASCMRSECHTIEELESANIDFGGIRFTHKRHVAKAVDGIEISCGTCHSHFEGAEHFSVNKEVCFTCHFLKAGEDGPRLVQTTCLDCHDVPNKVIKRGLMTVNHAEFVSYEASCEDSCHKRQIEKTSRVPKTTCLNCHSFTKDKKATSIKLHEIHTTGEKVECFACHGNVQHGSTEADSIASAMIDCRNCHGDTHSVQGRIYSDTQHPMGGSSDRVLSPMFLAHVDCRGCHVEKTSLGSGPIGSIGTVARAVPRACDKCHEAGTGEKYVPFWQGNTKKLFEQVNSRLSRLQNRAQFEADKQVAEILQERARQAKLLLESVEADGSWGVHNLKYTEAMLMKANKIITEAQ